MKKGDNPPPPAFLSSLDYQDKDIDFSEVRKCFQAGDSQEKELALHSIILADAGNPEVSKSRREELFNLFTTLFENDTPPEVFSKELSLPLRVAGIVSYKGIDLSRLLVYLKYLKSKNVNISGPLSKRLFLQECLKEQLQKIPPKDRKPVISGFAEIMDKDVLDEIIKSLPENPE